MQETSAQRTDWQEILVLSLVPGVVGLLTLTSWALSTWEIAPWALHAGLALLGTLLGGYQRILAGFRDLIGRRISVNVFVAVALVATMAVGEFRAAAVIVFIMAVAGALESYTLDKTRRSIRELLDFAPTQATVRTDSGEAQVPVSELTIDDIVVIRPGERIPVDGQVVVGNSTVNEAPITGESVPVEKELGAEVYAGTLNELGRLEVRVTRNGEDTTLARIVHLVEEAQGSRAPIQTLADRFTAWFLPTVLVLAAIGYALTRDVHVAVSVLLVACPCAFAIATPTAVTAGISNMARRGILVKGGASLEKAAKVDALLLDKTGTLTLGRPAVVQVESLSGRSADEILQMAAVAEKYSEHPLAKAILAMAQDKGLNPPDPEEFRAHTGLGVVAVYGDQEVVVGKEAHLQRLGILFEPHMRKPADQQAQHGRTVIWVACNRQVVGLIGVADTVRPRAASTVLQLRQFGISHLGMLTGDSNLVARAVSAEVGMDEVHADLLPADKLDLVRRLQAHGRCVAMIGDGINDAPALAQADVGIAMGAAGTGVAIEAASVTLMSEEFEHLAAFFWMAKTVVRRIKLNIFFSIIYNVVGLVLGVMGLLTPITAVVFQELGCITVVLSSTLLLWVKPPCRSA